ncbi:hypothetical protein CEXT_90901 [Caerostris extrusa]|uniref:Uncharacterized protein n=1 Tax=Caerostris extrusa TaxID=172846 RepID=A0AAV4S655_CAEEX|nr:hypothetical protein CEXT_90901 [Caerostris extrusa]
MATMSCYTDCYLNLVTINHVEPLQFILVPVSKSWSTMVSTNHVPTWFWYSPCWSHGWLIVNLNPCDH